MKDQVQHNWDRELEIQQFFFLSQYLINVFDEMLTDKLDALKLQEDTIYQENYHSLNSHYFSVEDYSHLAHDQIKVDWTGEARRSICREAEAQRDWLTKTH